MTVNVENNTLEFDANWAEGSSNNKKSFIVSGSKGFRYEVSEGDWFDVTLTYNTFTVTVRENFNIGERNGYILLNNNMVHGNTSSEDTIDELEVDIHQNGMECTIDISENSVSFASNPTHEDGDKIIIKEDKTFTVTTTGGVKDFIIKEIREEYKKESIKTIVEDVEEREIRFHQTVEFDHGIKVEKISKTQLKITSYGCVFDPNDKRYIITLAHKNNREKITTITVTYS